MRDRHALMFGDYDRVKTRFTVPGNIQRDISNIGFQGFLAEAVPAVISRLRPGLMLLVSKMVIQLCLEHTFYGLLVEIMKKIIKL
jgi:hypothetical protein